jgi:hypothetical protein
MTARARAALVLGLGAVAGCASILGIEELVRSEVVDGGDDAAADAAPDANPCEHVRPPPPPEVDDAPAEELPPFVLALDTLGYARSVRAAEIGFDLDEVCTCDDRPGTTRGGTPSCAAARTVCDAPGGIDNTLGSLFEQNGLREDLLASNERIANGRETLLFYVRRYNGRPNDKDVELGFLASEGLRSAGCEGSSLTAEGYHRPGWCGDDAWTRAPGSLGPNGVPVVIAAGYVTEGVLVVDLPGGLTIPFATDLRVEMGFPTITAKLVPLGEDLKPRPPGPPRSEREKRLFAAEEGTIAGRILASNVLAGVGSIQFELPDGGLIGLCQMPLYLRVSEQICNARDIARTPALDFEDARCDALSTGVGFTAKPVVLGDEFAATRPERACTSVDGAPKVPSEYATTYTCPD